MCLSFCYFKPVLSACDIPMDKYSVLDELFSVPAFNFGSELPERILYQGLNPVCQLKVICLLNVGAVTR